MLLADPFILRPYRQSDAAAMSAAVRESTATVGRWMSWAKPDFSEYDAACWFEHCRQARAAGTAHEFGIFTADGGFVGGCGLNQFSPVNNLCNLGYWVRLSRQRQRVATRCVRLLSAFGFETLRLTRIEIVAAQGNQASQGVARAAGAQFEGVARNRLMIRGEPVAAAVFSLIPTERAGAVHA